MSRLKKSFPPVISLLIGIIIGILVAVAISAVSGRFFFQRTPVVNYASAELSNAELTAIAFSVVSHIKSGDYSELSRIVHPDLGVVFSPYATVNFSTNRRFSAEQVSMFATDSTSYVWGIYDGSGEPIEMTPSSYFAEFVFSRNYCESTIIGVNRIIKSGNALENITEMFPGVKFVEFHIPGGEKDSLEELDWGSLRLGFEEMDGRLWLTVIQNSRWTI